MRYLAIDLGDKRTGLAVGDDTTGIASPVGVIQTTSGEDRLDRIGRAVQEYEPDALVIGLPLNMDGTEGSACQGARALGEQLAKRFGLEAHLIDERLSSYGADLQMQRSGLTHKGKKSRRDAMAAAVILRTFSNQGDPPHRAIGSPIARCGSIHIVHHVFRVCCVGRRDPNSGENSRLLPYSPRTHEV